MTVVLARHRSVEEKLEAVDRRGGFAVCADQQPRVSLRLTYDEQERLSIMQDRERPSARAGLLAPALPADRGNRPRRVVLRRRRQSVASLRRGEQRGGLTARHGE